MSSSTRRDRDTHFKSGRTGSSTLRRTLGAILREDLELNPIPRSEKDIDANSTHFYCFDVKGESKLTDWMMTNLSMSYYPYLKSPAQIGTLEAALIKESIPSLNIAGNPNNPMRYQVQSFRKACSNLAYKVIPRSRPKEPIAKAVKLQSKNDGESSGKYVQIWKGYLSQLVPDSPHPQLLDKKIQLNGRLFQKLVSEKHTLFAYTLEMDCCKTISEGVK